MTIVRRNKNEAADRKAALAEEKAKKKADYLERQRDAAAEMNFQRQKSETLAALLKRSHALPINRMPPRGAWLPLAKASKALGHGKRVGLVRRAARKGQLASRRHQGRWLFCIPQVHP